MLITHATVHHSQLITLGYLCLVSTIPLPFRRCRSRCRCDESRSWSKVTKLRTVGSIILVR